MRNNLDIVEILLKAGADRSVQTHKGHTAKDIAVARNFTDIIDAFDA